MVELILPLEAPGLADPRKLCYNSGIDGIGLGQMALASGIVAPSLCANKGQGKQGTGIASCAREKQPVPSFPD